VSTPRLGGLWVYPVKGCRGTPLATAIVGERGLEGDREWMVVRPGGAFLTQRTHPQLARIVPRITAGGLELAAPHRAALAVAVPGADVVATDVSIWRDRLAAQDAGDAAADWLAALLGEPVRLVRIAPGALRRADPAYVGERVVPVSFVDGYPLLVCNAASLEELNRRQATPVPMDRFRPSVVVHGLAPFAEDRLAGLRIGALRLDFVKPCVRCSVPGVDQLTGEPGFDPFPALKSFRYDGTLKGVTFGVNAIVGAGAGAALAGDAPVEALQ
jgi:uncharacterized protein YcbX